MVTISQKDGVTCASQVSADPTTAGADLPSYVPPAALAPAVVETPFPWVPVILGVGTAAALCAVFCFDNNNNRSFIAVPPAQALSL